MSKSISLFLVILGLSLHPAIAQQTTPMSADTSKLGFTSGLGRTTFGGYGSVVYSRDIKAEYSEANLDRFVLLVSHKFNNKISFFGELEVENAKVAGGESGGEIALEQCFIKFDLNPSTYLTAGLFIPRIGYMNVNHLPTQFFGNRRHQVETKVIPTTWREIGVGIYGNLNSLPISYTFSVLNGLNSAAFEHGTGIRNGRYEGSNAGANNLAVTGSLQYYKGNFTAQISGYYGGSVSLAPPQADSLQLTGGAFGTPVFVTEADIQYSYKAWSAKLLATMISIPDAGSINSAYANNTPEQETGAYAEIAYNFFSNKSKYQSKDLFLFVRYETLNLNSEIPTNGIIDNTLDQQQIITGISYFPNSNVVIKMDMRFQHTGEPNPDLIINPSPQAPEYYTDNSFFTLGVGFSF